MKCCLSSFSFTSVDIEDRFCHIDVSMMRNQQFDVTMILWREKQLRLVGPLNQFFLKSNGWKISNGFRWKSHARHDSISFQEAKNVFLVIIENQISFILSHAVCWHDRWVNFMEKKRKIYSMSRYKICFSKIGIELIYFLLLERQKAIASMKG